MLIRRGLYSFVLYFALALAGQSQGTDLSFGGLKGDTTLPVEITSDQLEIDQADGTALFSGNVVIVQGNMRLSADQVHAAYTEATDTIETITATGNVLLVNATDAAEAEMAVYTISTGEVVLTGDVLLTQGAATLAAQRMVIDLKTGKGRMDGRVTTTFVPGTPR